MERFCLFVSDEKISAVLLDKIRGSGAFRRFKDTIYRYEIEKDWFKFKDEAYKEIAISWLESNGFAYADDMDRREKIFDLLASRLIVLLAWAQKRIAKRSAVFSTVLLFYSQLMQP